jgi:hypothetical protein
MNEVTRDGERVVVPRRGDQDVVTGSRRERLNARQRRTLEEVLDPGGGRPEFPAGLAEELRATLEDGLHDIVTQRTSADPLRVSKYPLRQVMSCEGLFVAEEGSDFEWSLATVRGRIVHRAIQRIVTGGRPTTPMDAVEAAIERYAEDTDPPGLAAFLVGLDAESWAELVQRASDLVTKFTTDWPTLRRRWLPRIESRVRVALCGRRLLLSGSFDLALGAPLGQQARALIVELKSGHRRGEDREDLRLYALLETLARGVPPHRVVTYYADEGECDVEDITVPVLEAAVDRTIEGARRIALLADGRREPELRPNPLCGWCPALLRCESGRRSVALPRGGRGGTNAIAGAGPAAPNPAGPNWDAASPDAAALTA